MDGGLGPLFASARAADEFDGRPISLAEVAGYAGQAGQNGTGGRATCGKVLQMLLQHLIAVIPRRIPWLQS